MTDVITVEIGEAPDRHWLVAVGSDGKSRVVARCDQPEQAEIVANALMGMTLEELADVEERLAVLAKRHAVAASFRAAAGAFR